VNLPVGFWCSSNMSVATMAAAFEYLHVHTWLQPRHEHKNSYTYLTMVYVACPQ